MEHERRESPPRRRGLSLPARMVMGALAIFGAITLVQWVIASLLGVVKLALLVVVVVGIAAWVIGTKGNR